MATTEKVGAVGHQVAASVKAFRRRSGMSVRDLSAKLKELGRPILPSGITLIEQGARRVDVDDLAALADVLGVSPSTLLLGVDPSEEIWAQFVEYEQTGALSPIVRAVRDAVIEHGVSPAWLLRFLETSTLMLPVYAEASMRRHPAGQED